jgi:hypothetical protein
MKGLWKRSAMLLTAAIATCAGATSASAAAWDVVGSTHVLDSPNLSFNMAAAGAGWSCASSQLHAEVRTSFVLAVTGASFKNCMGTAGGINCTATVGKTPADWLVTAISTSVTIANFTMSVTYEHTPGNPTACPLFGSTFTVTGALTGGGWNQPAHEILYSADSGLSAHISGALPATATGTLRDTTQTLTLTG